MRNNDFDRPKKMDREEVIYDVCERMELNRKNLFICYSDEITNRGTAAFVRNLKKELTK